MINDSIAKLVSYALKNGLIESSDRVYSINRLLEALHIDEYEEPNEKYSNIDLETVLNEILEYACKEGLCENSVVYRDLFDTKLMGLLTPHQKLTASLHKSIKAHLKKQQIIFMIYPKIRTT